MLVEGESILYCLRVSQNMSRTYPPENTCAKLKLTEIRLWLQNTAPDMNSLKVWCIQCWEFASTHARGKGISCEALIPLLNLPRDQGSLGSWSELQASAAESV